MFRQHSQQSLIELITADPSPLKVVMMCGLAGSGKTTFAKALEKYGFQRLSIDEEIWRSHGKYGIDYPAENYESLQASTAETIWEKFLHLLEQQKNTVLDLSFWQRETRIAYKQVIEKKGAKYFLVFMNPPLPVIKQRLTIRNGTFEANAAFPVTNSILEKYQLGFEYPTYESGFEIT